MSDPWGAFAKELERWHREGREVAFWWRDDDAAKPTAPLARLLELSARWRMPLALAMVPLEADATLVSSLGDTVSVLQHGTDHANRAPAGEKKTEFPAGEQDAAAISRLREARHRIEAARNFVPALVPPWNRIRGELVPRLAAAGWRGLSQYGARRSAAPVPGLRQVNTHVDIIAWQAGRGFAGEASALNLATAHLAAKRHAMVDGTEPTGWLTHHACHDEAAWRFLERLFETTLGVTGVRWVSAQELFNAA